MQILFHGVISMKQRLSICIFFGIIFSVSIAGLAAMELSLQKEQNRAQHLQEMAEVTEKPEEIAESSLLVEPYKYILLEDEGRLYVYKPDRTTLYMETGILAANLPEQLKRELEDGICFVSEEELFDFLESYSS